jgi:hypothetical protein
LNNYRFNPDELRELVRGLFRQDYQKEVDEVTACRNARPVEDVAVVHDDAPEIEIMHGPPPSSEPPSAPTAPNDPAKKGGGGFWGRVKSKLSPKG